MRTLCTAVLVSILIGILLGFSIAWGFLSVNAWQPESETKEYGSLAKQAFTQVTNPRVKASIEETTYNFGVMNVKASGTHDYFIKNTGTEDLILKLDRMSCSCTDIKITPERVPPGQTATCHLEYNADRAMTGKFRQGGVIITNDPEHREIQLTIEGVFTDPVVIRPSTVSIPKAAAGQPHTAVIRFYGFEKEPIQILSSVWQDREHIDFQWKTTELNAADKEDSLTSLALSVIEGTITIKPGLPVGSFQDWFQVKTNYASHSAVSFSVNGQVVGGNISVSGRGFNKATGILDLGSTVSGKGVSRDLSIRFSGASAFSATVQVQSTEPEWIRAELLPPKEAGPLRIFTLHVEIPDNAPIGSYILRDGGQQAAVTLKTNNPDMPELKIAMQFAVGK